MKSCRMTVLVISGMLLLGGCASTKDKNFVQTAPATRLVADDGISFVPPAGWWQVHIAGHRNIRFTADGLDIDVLELRTLAPGASFNDSVAKAPQTEAPTPLLYRSGMTAGDIQKLQLDTLGRHGARQIHGSELHPSQFGDVRGFRFRYYFVDHDGLARQGMALGAIRDGYLDLFTFDAPDFYYFEHLRPKVEEVWATLHTP